MKRSGSLSLMVMGAAAFTASFAGGSAFLAWQKPTPSQVCTTRPDGTQACTPGGSTRFVHVSTSPERATAATASGAQLADPRQSARTAASSDGTARRGFGVSAKTAFRGSAGG